MSRQLTCITLIILLVTSVDLAMGQDTGNPFKEPTQKTEASNKAGENPTQEENPFESPKQESKQGSVFGEPVQEGSPFNTTQSESKVEDPFKEPGDSIVQDENPFGERTNQTDQTAAGDAAASNTQETQTLPAEKTFEEKFWDYLQSNAYQNWAPVPGTSDDYYVGESPHGAFLKMYLNRIAAGNPDSLPSGSIIVKENYAVDRSTLKAITVMYRSRGYNPAAGDWYWIKYNADGTVATTPPENGGDKIMGKASGCIDCHSGAEDDDFTFFNDR